MRVFIEYKPNESGKGKFISRLIPELKRNGCDVSFKPHNADIRLSLTRFRTESSLPTVLRVDGIHLEKTKKTKWNNARVKRCIRKADHVIFQSKFAKETVSDILRVKPKASSVIMNGANPDDYFRGLEKKIDVIMVARWKDRKHKRLTDMIKVAIKNDKWNYVVCGEVDKDYLFPPNVKHVGLVTETELRSYLSVSKCMLNLVEYDWCPNAVVEAVVAGVPVVCLSGTGVGEIVKGSGFQIPRKFNLSSAAKGQFSDIDFTMVATAMGYLIEHGKEETEREDLHIKTIGKLYYNVFKKVLGGTNE